MSRTTETHMFVVTGDSVAHSHFVEIVTFINRCFRFIIFIGIGQRIPSIPPYKVATVPGRLFPMILLDQYPFST